MSDVNILLAFGAGFLSFISPCCLPLYPSFISYITGVSIDDLKGNKGMFQKRAIFHTLFFLLGFSIIFLALGFSTSLIGSLFTRYNDLLRQLGAILIVFFGLVVSGILNPRFLMKDKKIAFKSKPSGYFGSLFIGLAFAAGWTPCTGPILAAVIAMGVSNPSGGLFYMVMYTLGFSIPFIIMAFFIGKINGMKRWTPKIIMFGGYGMIIMGIVLYFDWMTILISFLTNYLFGGFTGF
ncbi:MULTISPECIES: cytochrome c biogenesis CcdA family protein [Bacillaceae]|uniref:cytochrome c biogenesis CcdA family protein n=1 Tax=Bacillaceae TaxID=186817 RepID=UPI0005A7DD05|nr:cytochrome c biogenesis protein CcdA [Bacillus rubiinfantis]